jgi:hypothetical protein
MTLRAQYYREAAKIVEEEKALWVGKHKATNPSGVLDLVALRLRQLADEDEKQSLEHEFDEQPIA